MAPAEFRGIFNPSKTQYPALTDGGAWFFKNQFTIPQMLLVGALGQTAIFALLPARYAFLPLVAFLLHTVSTVVLQVNDPKNLYIQNVVPSRTSAQFPAASYNPESQESSLFGSKPASQGVVVLLLGFRISSPLGVGSKGGKAIGEMFQVCNKELAIRAEEFGFLGSSGWSGSDAPNNSTAMAIFYFRDVEGLNKFADGKVHREVWDTYNRMSKQPEYCHLGVFHETFHAGVGQYETVYVNMPPVLMGATNVKIRNEATGEDEWIRPLVDANNTILRSQWGRMGRAVKEGTSEY